MSSPLTTFREEAKEHLTLLENALLILEHDPYDSDQIRLAFRAMHTIKGAGGMVGFDHLSLFTHHLETFFEYVRNSLVTLTPEMISLVLDSSDHIAALLDDLDPAIELKQKSESLILSLSQFSPSQLNSGIAAIQNAQIDFSQQESLKHHIWTIDIKPSTNALKEGFDLLPLLRELHSLGPCQVTTRLQDELDLHAYDPQVCYLQTSILLSTHVPRCSIEDVFIFVQDDWIISIDCIELEDIDHLVDLLVSKGALSSDKIEEFLIHYPELDQASFVTDSTESKLIENTLLVQASTYTERQQKPIKAEEQNIRIPVGKLDVLMNLVGELVIAQVRLEQIASELQDDNLSGVSEELSRLSTELRDTAFDIRMLPIGTTFGRFKRLIRDLNHELGKSVKLETQGADTELDKMVLDKLADPLVHLLRNSMDHGIESSETRLLYGKPEQGIINLSASHSEGQILISIRDDGAGINTTQIEAKAIERGLISPDHDLSDEALHQLIFEPGFSTAEHVSDVSGRGVGMDVVRTSIDALRGRIKIQSKQGQGTVINIYLPMTLAIIEGLMVRVSDQCYVLPLSVVEECIETASSDITQKDGARLIEKRGELIACVRLREFFEIEGPSPDIEQTVVTRTDNDQLGITVDEVIGQHQTVIKSLSKLYRNTSGLMGATITGSGDVAMILDVNELAEEIAKQSSVKLNRQAGI